MAAAGAAGAGAAAGAAVGDGWRSRLDGRGRGGRRRPRADGSAPAGSVTGGGARAGPRHRRHSPTGGGAATCGLTVAGTPLIATRRSSRSRRARSPSVEWSAPGSRTRAHTSSRSSRGAVAPRISVRPVATRSAARLSSTPPNLAACATRRSALVLGHVDEPARRGVGDGGHDDQVAQAAQQVLGEAARVLPGLDDLVDDPEDRCAVAGRERLDDLVEQRVGRVAEQRRSPAGGSPRRVRTRPSAGRGPRGCRAPSPRPRGPPGAARPARWGRPRARRARRGTTTAAAAGSAGTGSGGCAT